MKEKKDWCVMKRMMIVVILLSLVLTIQQAFAQESWAVKTGWNCVKFGAGYFSAMGLHEVSHWGVSRILKIDMNYKWENYFSSRAPLFGTFDPKTEKWKIDILAKAGFASQVISSEIILDFSDLRTGDGGFDYYLCGWLFYVISAPFSYSMHDAETARGYGDLYSIKWAGGNKEAANQFMLAHATITLVRTLIKLQPNQDDNSFRVESTPTSISIAFNF